MKQKVTLTNNTLTVTATLYAKSNDIARYAETIILTSFSDWDMYDHIYIELFETPGTKVKMVCTLSFDLPDDIESVDCYMKECQNFGLICKSFIKSATLSWPAQEMLEGIAKILY